MLYVGHRPDADVVRRNRAFLALCLGAEQFERLHAEIEDLLMLDSGSWGLDQIQHHCKGVFCCRSIEETRAKLENAIVVAWHL